MLFRYLYLVMIKTSFTVSFIILILSCGNLFAQETAASTGEKVLALEYFIQGITDFENEDYERALDNLTAAHLRLSDDPGINYALSDVYLAMGDYTNASYYARVAADADPSNRWYQLQLAEVYRQTGQYEAIIDVFNTILEHHPGDPDILYKKSQAYIEFGELRKSNETLDQLIQIRGSDFDLHLRKFQNYNALQMRDSALVQLELMRDLNPGNISTLHSISQHYLELGDEQSARETLLDARERNSRNPQTLILLAEIFIDNEEWENLGQTFLSMVEDPLIYPTQKLQLVQYLYSQYQQHPGEPLLKEYTELTILQFSRNEPDYAPAQLIASEFFIRQNNPELALETLERASSATPKEEQVWRQRLQILFSLERYGEVIRLSEQAEQYAPNNASILFFTGASYMMNNQPEEAISFLEKATKSPARSNFRSVIYSTLGDLRQDLDRWEPAVDAYETALRLDSNNHNAMNNYAYFLSNREERLEDALDLAKRAISFEPENTSYLDTIGWIHYKLGNYTEAKSYIEKAVETGDASAEVYEHLGDIFWALDNSERAFYMWKKAVELDPDRSYLLERIP